MTVFETTRGNVELKFDFAFMFKVDKAMSTKNAETGQPNMDGVGALFTGIANRDEEALVALLQTASKRSLSKELTEDEAVASLEKKFEEIGTDDPEEALFAEIQADMVASGFFKKKILKYIEQLEMAYDFMREQKTDDEQVKAFQLKQFKKQISLLKGAIS